MPSPTEHKTFQSCILKYAQEIGWSFVSQTESKKRLGLDFKAPFVASPFKRLLKESATVQ
ncbi:MAG TPA: hypothetical protein VJL89_09365 [Thermodesulfovibrionia bacterium]|nr:hypothetical protein [Thermodesulfovibrionia bacterium]